MRAHSHDKQDGGRISRRFDGESTMRKDFQPPSHEALMEASQLGARSHDQLTRMKSSRSFESDSTTQRGFQPPSNDALLKVSQPGESSLDRLSRMSTSCSFESDSTMHRASQPRLRDAFAETFQAQAHIDKKPRCDPSVRGFSVDSTSQRGTCVKCFLVIRPASLG